MAPPNSGPKLREIIKYGPPAGTTPLVAIALILMAVNIVCEAKGTNNQPIIIRMAPTSGSASPANNENIQHKRTE
jgi:hypothetical protein